MILGSSQTVILLHRVRNGSSDVSVPATFYSYKAEQIPEILTMPVYSTSSLVDISMTESIYSTAFGSYTAILRKFSDSSECVRIEREFVQCSYLLHSLSGVEEL